MFESRYAGTIVSHTINKKMKKIKVTGKAGEITKADLWDLYQDILMIDGYAR